MTTNANAGVARTKAKRIIVRVQYKKLYWTITSPGQRPRTCPTKHAAVTQAAWECDYTWRNSGVKTQLVIYRKDGKIQSERTYGADPVRRKG